MSGFVSQVFRLSVLVAVPFFYGPAQAQSPRQTAEPPLQQVADQAALAAVQVLGAGGGSDEAVAVAQQTVASASGLVAQVSMSPGKAAVTVRISPSVEKEETVVSTARYVPPEHPVKWSWASRQRFAVKSSPVIVGSNCPQGCDPVR